MNIFPEFRTERDLLAVHYRAIGPAAIMAALLCVPRSRRKNSNVRISH